MAEAELSCPNCGEPVGLGDVTCSNCGVNLRSGETYDSRVKRARGRGEHKKTYTGGLYMGVVGAFLLFVFAGYMYHRSMNKVISQVPQFFRGPVQELHEIRGMVHAGQTQEARQRLDALIQELDQKASSIKIESFTGAEQISNPGMRRAKKTEWSKRSAKRLLYRLKAEAETLRDEIAAS